MQQEIRDPGPLLDREGRLAARGWSRSPLLAYERGAVRAPGLRVKEWDYYLVQGPGLAAAFTVADNSYMGLLSFSFLDLEEGWQKTESLILPLTRGRLGLPADSRGGDIAVRAKGLWVSVKVGEASRRIAASVPAFDGGGGFEAELELYDEPADSMVIATPFPGRPRHFYYNRKIIGMRARGVLRYGDRYIELDPAVSFGLLDWGRGVWPYAGTWYWSAAMGLVGGRRFGWNLGYGFGDTSAATENALFLEGRAHKLEAVDFGIPLDPEGREDYGRPWDVGSSDGRLEAVFLPRLDRASKTALGPLLSDQHQVFGTFTGRATLDGGEVLEFRDLPGFAEKVRNRW